MPSPPDMGLLRRATLDYVCLGKRVGAGGSIVFEVTCFDTWVWFWGTPVRGAVVEVTMFGVGR